MIFYHNNIVVVVLLFAILPYLCEDTDKKLYSLSERYLCLTAQACELLGRVTQEYGQPQLSCHQDEDHYQ